MNADIEELIAHSKANEAIARKLFEIETEVLACQTSEELLTRLFNAIKCKFNIDGITLIMAEPTPISYMLSSSMQSKWHTSNTQTISQMRLDHLHQDNKPVLTNDFSTLKHSLCPEVLVDAKSLALLPLWLENKLFASLLFTDKDKDRFTQTHGTFHLEQLAVRVSLCLSNVLVREQLEYLANYDRLTGVANRRLMELSINEELLRQKRYQVPFSILFIDCNKFKSINDTYGHECGDKVLAYVASQLQQLIRENDSCFRYAGDEFVVVLASQSGKEAALAAKRICRHFTEHPMSHENISLQISISCGVAASDGKQDMKELLKRADQQLYLEKEAL
jgi:diguanylate cyclase (GGDEF)-like protein